MYQQDSRTSYRNILFLGTDQSFNEVRSFITKDFIIKPIPPAFINTAISSNDKLFNYPTKDYLIIVEYSILKELGIISHFRRAGNIPILFLAEQHEEEEITIFLNRRETSIPVMDYIAVPIFQEKILFKINSLYEIVKISEKNELYKKELDLFSVTGADLHLEKDINKLLASILKNARDITGSDAGSIYIAEDAGRKKKKLKFILTQGDSIKSEFDQFFVDADKGSIAGYAFITKEAIVIEDVYKIPKDSPFIFNKMIDEKIDYHTKSMLTIPLNNHNDEVIGVLQLINKKDTAGIRLSSKEMIEKHAISFNERDVKYISSFAGHAAILLENSILYQEINLLLEGFIKASVKAIEARDPVTAGHSERVSILSKTLAQRLKLKDGELREIEYAALLHDFGKVGVREDILLKEARLNRRDLEIIRWRFDFIKRTAQFHNYKKRLEYITKCGKENFLKAEERLEEDLQRYLDEIEQGFDLIYKANYAPLISDDMKQYIKAIASWEYTNIKGEIEPVLTCNEFVNITIPYGTLTSEERKNIESHVVHSYNFLKEIPWTRYMELIPDIVCSHHEYLNGRGYPKGISGDAIPLQARIIEIADVYDALTAQDRPYKKAMSAADAIAILQKDAENGRLDKGILEIFVRDRVYEIIN